MPVSPESDIEEPLAQPSDSEVANNPAPVVPKPDIEELPALPPIKHKTKDELLELAEQARAEKDFPAAISCYNAAIELYGGDSTIYKDLTDCCMESERFDEMIKAAESLIEEAQKHSDLKLEHHGNIILEKANLADLRKKMKSLGYL